MTPAGLPSTNHIRIAERIPLGFAAAATPGGWFEFGVGGVCNVRLSVQLC